jgi:hypothetical protein
MFDREREGLFGKMGGFWKRTFNKRCLKRKKKERKANSSPPSPPPFAAYISVVFSENWSRNVSRVSLTFPSRYIASTVNYRNAGPSHTKPSLLSSLSLSLGILPFRDLLSFFLSSSSFLFSFANYRRREFEQEIKKEKKKS